MKRTNRNKFRQILSLLMVMAVTAGSTVIAPHFNAKTTVDTPADIVESADKNDIPNVAIDNTSDPDIDVLSFRSDTQGIPVGESKDVIFTAEIAGPIGSGDHDVSVLDDNDQLIGYMLDNGDNGDEAANDGVFTLTATLSSDEETTVKYHPNAKGVDGSEVMIGFYTPLSDEEWDQMDTTETEIKDFVGSDNFQQKSDGDKVAAAGEFLDQLASDGKIKSDSVYYDEHAKQYAFEYNTSALGAISLTDFNDDTNGTATDASFDLSDQFTVNSAATAPLTNVQNSSSELAATGSGSSLKAIVLNGFENSTYRRSFYQTLQSQWNNKGLSTTVDIDVTIGDMKNLGAYDVVVFAMHGSEYRTSSSSSKTPVISINQTPTSSTDRTYAYELTTRHSVVRVTLSSGANAYWILPSFFTDTYSSSGLNGKFIYSETCMFYGCDCQSTTPDYSMSNALKNCSASAVVGYHNSVGADYSRDMMKYVVEKCYDGVELTTAVNNAKSIYGSNDGWQDTSDHKYYAYPVVNPNNSRFVLRSGSSLTPSAESISLNSSKTATISTGGDIKYYKITPSATTQVQFYSTGSYDTYGYLYDANMNQLASNDDGGDNYNFKITYTLSANTTYYLGCKFYSSSRTGSFTVKLESPYEAITLGSSKTATISTAGSMKYYTYTPTATTQVQFYSTGSYDTYGYLYSSSMTQLASNDDGGTDHNFKITYTLSANTTYIFGCKFYSSSRTGSFTVRLENPYEAISLGSSKTATISTGGSMKYYTYTPTATTQVQFYSTGSYDTYGYLYSSSMTQLASNDDGGDNYNFKITYTLSANTTYIFGCKFYSSSRTGSFTVRLENPYEAISLGSSKTATISTGDSIKYYTYTPTATTQVQFYSTGSYDTYGYLYSSSMSQLASNDDGGDNYNFKITYTLSANTTYIFACKFYSSSRTGSFTVKLEKPYEAISLGSSKTATISAGGSMRYYTITPTSTTKVQFYSTGSYDTYGYLYNANMSQLASNDDGGDNYNFKITYTLSANTTYIFGCKFYSSSKTGSFTVRLDAVNVSQINVNISTPGTMKYYSITPASNKQMTFYSTGSYDTYGYLYDANMNQLASNDDGGDNYNFKITYTLRANTKYCLGCKFYSSSKTGSFDIFVETVPVNSNTESLESTGEDMMNHQVDALDEIEIIEVNDDEIGFIGETDQISESIDEYQPADESTDETVTPTEDDPVAIEAVIDAENVYVLSE